MRKLLLISASGLQNTCINEGQRVLMSFLPKAAGMNGATA